jgi:hypothetical protein
MTSDLLKYRKYTGHSEAIPFKWVNASQGRYRGHAKCFSILFLFSMIADLQANGESFMARKRIKYCLKFCHVSFSLMKVCNLMNDLLKRVIEVHGGLDRFNQFQSLSLHQRLGGALWELKGQEKVLDDVRVTVDLHRQHTTFTPFKLLNHHADFTAGRVTIETSEGEVIAERTDPRAAFAEYTLQTKWDDLHLIYFAGYALSTYLTCPFSLSHPDFDVTEIEPWQEQGETWRRLKVTYPSFFATHTVEQTFYFGEDGLWRRHDYTVDISANAPAVHYLNDYQDVSGIMIPTKQRVFVRQTDNTPDFDVMIVSMDFSDMRFD